MEKKIITIEEIDGTVDFKNEGFSRMEIIGILKTYLEVIIESSKKIIKDNAKTK